MRMDRKSNQKRKPLKKGVRECRYPLLKNRNLFFSRVPTSALLAGFISGVLLPMYLPGTISLGCSATFVFVTFFVVLSALFIGIFAKKAAFIIALPMVMLVGYGWSSWTACQVLDSQLAKHLQKKDVQLIGYVVGLPHKSARHIRFDFQVEKLTYNGEEAKFTGRVRLKDYSAKQNYRPGQHWQLTARMKRPRGYQNPGALFDYERYLFANRIIASGYVRDESDNRQLVQSQSNWLPAINRIRNDLAIQATTLLSGREVAAVINALTVGIRQQMSDEQWHIFRLTGTTHLMAISGLHIGLVAGVVGMLVAMLWRRMPLLPLFLPTRIAGLAIGTCAGIFYAVLAGLTIPTQRAMFMLIFALILLSSRRKPSLIQVLLWVITMVLLIDPMSILQNGFWLSFAAVAVLLLCITRTSPNASNGLKARIIRWGLGWCRTQWALFVFLAPILLLFFGQVSLVAPVANLVAIPLVGTISVPLALTGLILSAIGIESVSAWFYAVSAWVIQSVMTYLEWLSLWPYAVWRQAPIEVTTMFWLGPGLLLISMRRWSRMWWLGFFFWLPVVAPNHGELSTGEFRYTMLEIGHGLASVVQTRNRILVYDTGPRFAGGIDSGESVVLPFLRYLVAKRVDKLVISHGDNDHIGGQQTVSAGIAVTSTYTSVPDKIPHSFTCQQGQTWQWDGVIFDVLWPLPNNQYSGNDGSCVIRIHSSYGSLLLTGDIEKKAEKALLGEASASLRSDVLQVPHQGSRTSSTQPFLDAVSPDIALVSTAYLNHYRHPHKDVRQRYRQRNVSWYDTAYEGAITVTIAKEGMTVRRHRRQQKQFWIDQTVNEKGKERIPSPEAPFAK